MENFIDGWRTNSLLKRSSIVAFELHLVQHVLVLVHLLSPVHAEVFHFILAHVRGVCVPYGYRKMDGAALPTLHYPPTHKRRESCG